MTRAIDPVTEEEPIPPDRGPAPDDRLLLRLYPGAFRRRWSSAMVEFYRDRRRATAPGGIATLRLWRRLIADILANAAAEHFAAMTSTPARPRRAHP
jgi:hypothetical protein